MGVPDTADTIPQTVAGLAAQLTSQLPHSPELPHGPVSWSITGPAASSTVATKILNRRLDLLDKAVDQLAEELHPQLHCAADSRPHRRQAHPARSGTPSQAR